MTPAQQRADRLIHRLNPHPHLKNRIAGYNEFC